MKIISFSIWGDSPLYRDGALQNVIIAKTIYPDWVCRIYHDGLPEDVKTAFIKEGAQLVSMAHSDNWSGLFWRFLPAAEKNVEAFIVRDADSRVNERERAAVDEWLASDKPFHCMRDHYEHNVPIMGGMWGCRGKIKSFINMLDTWKQNSHKGDDQTFLAANLWPIFREKALVHDCYHDGFIRVLSNARMIKWDDVVEYTDEEFCGALNEQQYAIGKIVLKSGEILDRRDVYEYRPLFLFGEHDIRPFPSHPPMSYGVHVGEIIR